MKVSQLDPTREYAMIKDEVNRKMIEVAASGRYILGPNVENLEASVSQYEGTSYGVGVASGSDALLLSLMAVGISKGDGVITTPFTFFATVSSIYRLGGFPIFADIEPDTYNISPESIEELLDNAEMKNGVAYVNTRIGKITVRGILPVHLFGQPARMDKIMDIAARYNLFVVEDAAQAIGAEYDSRRVGTFGLASILSFFPTKNLGTYGDGGMVLTSDKELYEKLKILRVHGSKPKYYHKYIGINSRLDALHAAILLVKIKYLDKWIEMRQEVAERYHRIFAEYGLNEIVTLPVTDKHTTRHVWNQFVIRVKKRDELARFLKEQEIGTSIYYPLGLHLQECFGGLKYKEGDFPEVEKASHEVLALPMYAFLKEEEQRYIASKIKEFYGV